MVKHIPTKYAFKYFKAAIVTLALLLLTLGITQTSTPRLLVLYGKTLVASLFLVSLLVFLSLEAVNFKDGRRFTESHYRYDSEGIYRERVLIMPWEKVAGVVFDYEVFVDKIPAHRDVAWVPWHNGIRYFETPELTRKAKVSRIQVLTKEAGSKQVLSIETTLFRPLLLYMYRDMKGEAERSGCTVPFDRITSRAVKSRNDTDDPASQE